MDELEDRYSTHMVMLKVDMATGLFSLPDLNVTGRSLHAVLEDPPLFGKLDLNIFSWSTKLFYDIHLLIILLI